MIKKTNRVWSLTTAIILGSSLYTSHLQAETYLIPQNGDTVIGDLKTTTTTYQDTISDVAFRFGQGFREMRIANPLIDAWLPGDGSQVVIPSQYILPNTSHEGIVINVPEMRMYYYPKPKKGEPAFVVTYPISIGRQDWSTPHGETKIVSKTVKPSWYPPESIRIEHEEKGDPLPRIVPAGPDNPLGEYAMKLGIPGYLVHSTNKPYGLGMRVTHGCIRMYPTHIESLFKDVKVGTRVRIVNQPYKVGWKGDRLYLETHPHLAEDEEKFKDHYSHVIGLMIDAMGDRQQDIDWEQLQSALANASGIPMAVGLGVVRQAETSQLDTNATTVSTAKNDS